MLLGKWDRNLIRIIRRFESWYDCVATHNNFKSWSSIREGILIMCIGLHPKDLLSIAEDFHSKVCDLCNSDMAIVYTQKLGTEFKIYDSTDETITLTASALVDIENMSDRLYNHVKNNLKRLGKDS